MTEFSSSVDVIYHFTVKVQLKKQKRIDYFVVFNRTTILHVLEAIRDIKMLVNTAE